MFLSTSVSLKPSCDGLSENVGGGGADAPYLILTVLAGSVAVLSGYRHRNGCAQVD